MTAVCDKTSTCPADRHHTVCLGLYRTLDEVATRVVPDDAELTARRERQLTLWGVALAEQSRYGIGGQP